MRQLRHAVSGAASEIEGAPGRSEARRKSVAGHMLGPQIVVDFAGDNAFARELRHDAAAPAPTRAFTSTRQGKWNWPYTAPSSDFSIWRATALSIQSQIA